MAEPSDQPDQERFSVEFAVAALAERIKTAIDSRELAVRIDLSFDGICPAAYGTAVLWVAEELLTNAIEHGFYKRRRGQIFLHISTCIDSGIEILASDDGWGFGSELAVTGNGFLLLRQIGELSVNVRRSPPVASASVKVVIPFLPPQASMWRMSSEPAGPATREAIPTGDSMPTDTVNLESTSAETFGADYYASHCGALVYGRQERHWGRFFRGIAERIVQTLSPRSVFDAGCAHGFLLEALRDKGIEVRGRDISKFAMSEVRDDMRPFVEQGTIADKIDGSYDLVTCIEVLEHISEEEAVCAIASMAAAAPRLLFSSSPSDFKEPTHINVKPVIWWLHRFADVGLAPVKDYDASFITAHAYLLERSENRIEMAELVAFSDLIERRRLSPQHRPLPNWMTARSLRSLADAMPTSARRVMRALLGISGSKLEAFRTAVKAHPYLEIRRRSAEGRNGS
jgi:SAM-dependent methyltransferase